jgi:hypothetical protein
MALGKKKLLNGFEKGQILIVAVLVIVIALTVGLSLIARTITNLRTSTEEAQSQKALAAAEAGIERALQNTQSGSIAGSQDNNAGYNTVVTSIGGTSISIVLNGGSPVSKNEGIDAWFEAHDAAGNPNGVFTAPSNLNLYWGSSSACNDAAIEVIVVTTNAGNAKTYRFAYDPCSTRGNNFTTAPTVVAGNFPITTNGVTTTFASKVTIDTSAITNNVDKIIFMRLIPIYKDTILGISNNIPLPLQGYLIDSAGTSGETKRMIKVFKGYPQTPLAYLSYGLFVPCDINGCN